MSRARHTWRPSPRPFLANRCAHTNSLRRLFGLQLLAESLPQALGLLLIDTWMQRTRYDGNQATQSFYRQRPEEAFFPYIAPALLQTYLRIELEVARRMVEIPQTEITRERRSALLRAQSAYLCSLYAALAGHWGQAAAQAEFEHLLLNVG
jgi:hypothetical protein